MHNYYKEWDPFKEFDNKSSATRVKPISINIKNMSSKTSSMLKDQTKINIVSTRFIYHKENSEETNTDMKMLLWGRTLCKHH